MTIGRCVLQTSLRRSVTIIRRTPTMAHELPDSTDTIPTAARALGYGGVVPFLAAAINVAAGGPLAPATALTVFLYYAAIILSFLGGIRWGASVNDEQRLVRELGLSVVPSLWAFACLLLPGSSDAVWFLLAGFVAMGIADSIWRPASMPPWMRRLRIQLTAAVSACHVLVGVALAA